VALAAALALGAVAAPGPPAGADPNRPGPARAWHFDLGHEIRWSSPTVADLDGDGHDEIVVGSLDGHLYVLNANGTLRWHREVRTPGSAGPVAVDASPTVADVDGDGDLEILVGAGSLFVPRQHGGLVVFDRHGNVRWTRGFGDILDVWNPARKGPDGFREPVVASPVVGDVNGDGLPEIVVAAQDNRIHVLRPDGSPLPGWVSDNGHHGPGYWIDDAVFSTPVVFDGDGDGLDEIYFGATSTPGGSVDVSGGVVLALEMVGGRARTKWVRAFDDVIVSSPVAADINGDGRFEVIIGGGLEYAMTQPHRGDWRRVFALHSDDGSNVAGWPVTLNGMVWSAPAVGDVTGDGRAEVVVATNPHPSGDGRVVALRGDGTQVWSVVPNTCFPYGCEGGGGILAPPVLADLTGDGRQDVAVANHWGTFLLRGSDGARLGQAIEIGRGNQAGLAVGQAGSRWQLITATFGGSPRGRISAYPIPSAVPPAWSQFRGGPDKRGVAGFHVDIEMTPTGSGYWRLTAAGRVTAHGDAVHAGSAEQRLRPSEQAVSLSRTPTGAGYWVFTNQGRALAFGDAGHFGDMTGVRLNGPVLDSVPRPDGRGYYMVASDGGVFAFNAPFHGSMGATPLNAPVQSLSPTPDGAGYWLVASDGGVFAFNAPFRGSMGGIPLNAPVTGMVPYGNGYLLVARDGGVFVFSDRPFSGSLGASPPRAGVVAISAHPSGNGYVLLDASGRVHPFGVAAAYP
jgi:ribosomal protein L24E